MYGWGHGGGTGVGPRCRVEHPVVELVGPLVGHVGVGEEDEAHPTSLVARPAHVT